MLRPFVLSLVLVLAAPAWAQYGYGPATYKIERNDENYEYLKDDRPTDIFDPVKYIPLNAAGDWYLSFGGQARYRYDYFNYNNFGAGARDPDGFHLFRALAEVDAHFGPNFRAFVQLDSAWVLDRSGGPREGDADQVDLQQAFGEVKVAVGQSNSLMLRVGRQELIYGAQRLISPNDWRNVRQTFDGVKATWSTTNNTLDAFWTRPVMVQQKEFNSYNDDVSFAGIYNVTALPKLIPEAGTKLDFYLLALNNNQSPTMPVGSDTYTIGGRIHATPHPFDFDVEADWQFGRSGDQALNAYAIAAGAGYTFPCAQLSPRVSLGLDLASGSPSGSHRFNQLFPPQYEYLGHMYLFGRQNLIDVHPGVSMNLTPDLSLYAEEHIFWRQNSGDAVYNLGGGVVRASTGSNAAYIGNEFDVVLNWQIQRHFSTYVGYAHFFTGDFINDTGPHEAMNFFYAAATFTF